MSGSTIGSKVTIGVTLGITTGSGTYANPLTVTPSGDIAPSAYGATALSASISAGYVLNQGTIAGGAGSAAGTTGGVGGTGATGVDLAIGSLTNDGTIAAGSGGAGGTGASSVYGGAGGAGGTGVDLAAGSFLTNGGTIAGGIGGTGGGGGSARYAGVGGAGGAGVGLAAGGLTNQGTITGGTGGAGGAAGFGHYGVAGGSGGAGVYLAAGSMTNDGTIVGGTGGSGSGYALPGVGGVGGAGGIGVLFHGGGTLIDAGFIGGGSGAGGTADAVYFGSGASLLILDPAASFGGAVVADVYVSNVLELAPAGSAGTIAGLGDSFTGFGTLQLDPGAAWFIQGNSAGLAAGQVIDGFALGDTLELTGFVATGDSFIPSGLLLSGTADPATIGIQGNFAASDFAVTNDGTNSFVELQAPCFAAGTRIATRRGDIAVEALRVGETMKLLPCNGSAPAIWIGRRVVSCTRHRQPRQVWPVRIAAGAFGPGQPCRDLFLSPDHAVFVADVLIPVKYLVNGCTIVQVPMDEVTYYHVELPRHALLLAEGLPWKAISTQATAETSPMAAGRSHSIPTSPRVSGKPKAARRSSSPDRNSMPRDDR